LYEALSSDTTFSFEVFVVDDGSTDGLTTQLLLDIAAEERPNFYFLSTSKMSGAGRTRNIVAIPLAEGQYIYFADADEDSYNFVALKEAVNYAKSKAGIDLLALPYFVDTVHTNTSSTQSGMMPPSDDRVWKTVRSNLGNLTQADRKKAAFSLINYPWKQITSSNLLFDADIYFDGYVVHNDVQFHWT
jgi:glycosyltransferase involved in cell wall biosynthesis